MWASICLLMDTGIRIDEMLKLKMEDVDIDTLILKVKGKGKKERLVPFSSEMRRVLFLFLKKKRP